MKPFKILLLVLLIAIAIPVVADVGGYVDYDYPSGSDFNYDYDDYNYDSWSTGNDYGFGIDPYTTSYFGRALGFSPVTIIILIIVLRFVIPRLMGRGSGNRRGSSTYRRQSFPTNNGPVIKNGPVMKNDASVNQKAQTNIQRDTLNALRESDPSFSELTFLGRVSNMFVQLQHAWMDKDWKQARPYEHDQIFHLHAKQLEQFIEKEETNMIEDITVLNTEIESYETDGPYEYLNTIIEARFRDYVIDDTTGQVIRGDKNRTVTMTYRWKLMRKRGTQTKETETTVTQCPNCGANLSIGQNGVCEYCGSEVTTGNHDWVLVQIERINQL